MLLHVIEAASPVEFQMGRAGHYGTGKVMQNPPVPLLSVLDLNVLEPPAVSRLASPLRVTDRVLENSKGPVSVLTRLDDLGVEIALVGVLFENQEFFRACPTV